MIVEKNGFHGVSHAVEKMDAYSKAPLVTSEDIPR